MNKKLILIIVLLAVFHFNGDRAQAGFFDWIKNSQNNYAQSVVTVIPSNMSFDDLYSIIQNSNQEQNATLTIQNNSVREIAVNKNKISVAAKSPGTFIVLATGYSSTIDQTDDSPFITASGTLVRDGIIAANFLPFGTVIRIPDIYGNKTFVVEDRMNSRYMYNIDIWFTERDLAKNFGVKKVKIEVVS